MSPKPVGSSPITDILFCRHIQREDPGIRWEATSLPGHLLQLVISGASRQECNGRVYDFEKGRLLWYHQDELVRGEVAQAPWCFYSVNFIAPLLLPPPFEARLFHPPFEETRALFERLLCAWEDAELADETRLYRVHAALLGILGLLCEQQGQEFQIDAEAQLWWKLETQLRENLGQAIDLYTLQRLAGCSAATINRASQRAVGTSPMKRVKQVRMSLARGLVLRSELTMTEIAERIGYQRIHEFSRDYKAYFGHSPTHERRAGQYSHDA